MNIYRPTIWKTCISALLVWLLVAGNLAASASLAAAGRRGAPVYFLPTVEIPAEVRAKIVKQAWKYSLIKEGRASIIVLSAKEISQVNNKIVYEIKFYLLVDQDRHFFKMKIPIETGPGVNPWLAAGLVVLAFVLGYIAR